MSAQIERSTGQRTTSALGITAAASLVLAGASLTAYALTAFTVADWTVAGPGLLVAAAGVAGLWNRWFHLAGLVPMSAILSVAGPILAYDLARPDESPYFVGTVAIIVGACLAAVFGTMSAVVPDRRAFAAAALTALVVTPIVFVFVVATSPASRVDAADISSAEQSAAIDIEMVDYAFAVDSTNLAAGRVIHLRNTGTLPHDFTIDDVDFAVFVPPGRETYVRLPEALPDGYVLVCTVGDHREQGMLIDVASRGS